MCTGKPKLHINTTTKSKLLKMLIQWHLGFTHAKSNIHMHKLAHPLDAHVQVMVNMVMMAVCVCLHLCVCM